MHTSRKMLAAILASTMTVISFTGFVSASGSSDSSGWRWESGRGYYYDNDYRANGWKTIDGFRYYFHEGVPATGLNELDGKTYYFDNNGHMVTGWKRLLDEWFYFNSDGSATIGLTKIDNALYYFDSYGYMYDDGLFSVGKDYDE